VGFGEVLRGDVRRKWPDMPWTDAEDVGH
jgi:hypothetical protein